MKKKMLQLAVAAAFVAPMSTYADATLYGKAHLSIDWVEATGPAGEDIDTWNVQSRSSRLGVKGSEDLGNGLKAIYQMEFQINMANQSSITNRNTFVGLAGNWGTFLYGIHDTPYKMSTGKMDYFADRLADYNKLVGFEDVRAEDAVAYVSPKMSGFQFAGALVMNGAVPEDLDAYSVALTYDNAGILGAIAYEDIEELAAKALGTSEEKFRIGLGYDHKMFAVSGLYETQDDIKGVTGVDADLWQISAKYKFGNSAVVGAFGQRDPSLGGTQDGWALGFDHKFSKRTTAYVLYGDSGYQLDGSYGVGGDPAGFSMGIEHSF